MFLPTAFFLPLQGWGISLSLIVLATIVADENSIATVFKGSQIFKCIWSSVMTFSESKRLLMGSLHFHRTEEAEIHLWALAELMLTDEAPEWKYPTCPFNRISARDFREKYCSLVGCEYEWKCQSYESVNTFLFSIFLWKKMRDMAPALKFLTISEQSQEQYKNLLDLRGSSTLDLESMT